MSLASGRGRCAACKPVHDKFAWDEEEGFANRMNLGKCVA